MTQIEIKVEAVTELVAASLIALTTEHAASSHGVPVAIFDTAPGVAYGPDDYFGGHRVAELVTLHASRQEGFSSDDIAAVRRFANSSAYVAG